MKRKINKRVCHIDDKFIGKEVIDNIEMLHLSSSTEVFKLAYTLNRTHVTNK